MTTTELTPPLDAPAGVEPRARDEIVPLIDAVPGYGPPILLAGPLVLFALALAGPFLVLLTLVLLLAAVAILVALAGAIVASPYLLVRRFGGHRHPRVAVQLVRVDAGRGQA
jgi:hypothetical protein